MMSFRTTSLSGWIWRRNHTFSGKLRSSSVFEASNVTYGYSSASRYKAVLMLQRGTIQRKFSTIISPFCGDDVHDIHEGHGQSHVILPNNEAEFIVVGGGLMGLSLAFHLWRNIENLSLVKASKHMAPVIAVVERDPTLSTASSSLSVGGIRQQYSHPTNIKLSMKSAEYLRNIKLHLGTAGHDLPDIQFNPQGYLFLASQNGADQLMTNYAAQVENGAKVMLMTQQKLKEVFPWINADGIELACYGLENEGWFDPWALMEALKIKLKSFGVRFIKGEVVGFKKKQPHGQDPVGRSVSTMPDGSMTEIEEILQGVYIKVHDVDKPVFVKSRGVCNCAGSWSKKITEMLGVGIDEPSCSHPVVKTGLPVEPRKRWVYTVHCPDGPLFDCPLLVDPSGCYIRREGFAGNYLCGMSPEDDDAVDHSNLDVNYDFFYEEVWPRLAHRIPAMEKLKLKSAWAGYYDYNTFDQNAVIGKHPYYSNFSFLTGFSGHGVQMAMGAAACLAENLVTGKGDLFKEIDITSLGFERFILNRPVIEANIV